jgi:predicted flap endonuclease-1-like 5' DNA nuclease
MMNLFDFCSIHWIFPWLLPFLLGLTLGWLLWAKYKSMLEDLETKISGLNIRIQGLEADLDVCKKARMEAEGNVSLLRNKMREMETSMSARMGAESVGGALGIAEIATTESSGDKWFAAIGTNKLQIIEGIGPKMEEVLHENGITDFSELAAKNPENLREMLQKYGDKYRIIDPNTWPQQASLANDRKWNELISLQKSLDMGRSDTATDGVTDSKLEKWLIKTGILRRWIQDDLKVVEGIGPKIEQLLHDADITTWRGLSQTSVSVLQAILRAAGSRFALADPANWPKQAELAADGQWDELQAYQDFLNNGKEK